MRFLFYCPEFIFPNYTFIIIILFVIGEVFIFREINLFSFREAVGQGAIEYFMKNGEKRRKRQIEEKRKEFNNWILNPLFPTSMIFEANETFPIDRLTLLTPKPIPGGNHFSRFHIDDTPVFVQLPKCSSKQGIQVAGNKKAYTDLQFTNDQERFLRWLETLVEKVQEIVFENSTKWFANEMDKVEIEDTFQSPLKPYRSGQMYLMRVNIPIRMGKITLPIFDEEETPVGHEMVKAGGNLLGVLEVQGLKYSPKSLQLELEVKQLLLLPSLSIFDKCVLAIPANKSSIAPSTITVITERLSEVEPEEKIKDAAETLAVSTVPPPSSASSSVIELSGNNPQPPPSQEKEEEDLKALEENSSPITEDSPQQEPPQQEEVQDVDICLENMTLQPIEPMQLKNSKEIYYKMYRQARQKAKLARDLAISSYLESKHIKNIYVLEDLSDEEDESNFFAIKSLK